MTETDEKLIPASRVREVARRYAATHGWCSVVDRALEEMGATDDSLVEVTVTRVSTIRLRRADVDKLQTGEQMTATAAQQVPAYAFRGNAVPDGAEVVDRDYTITEPVAAPAEGEARWVRITPGNAHRLRRGMRVRRVFDDGGTGMEGEVTRSDPGPDGDNETYVRFDGRDHSQWVRVDRLQFRV